MKIFDRNINFFNLFFYFQIFFRSLKYIHPHKFLYYYLSRKSPKKILLKQQKYLIHFSQHPHDFITFVVIFLKREYGEIPDNYTILDIGANIGLFSIYAYINNKKNNIIAFEPSLDAYKILKQNIILNNLSQSIKIYNGAISSKKDSKIKFPKKSSPYNTLKNSYSEETAIINNYNINDFLNQNKNIFLKLDCEGSELDIIRSIEPNNFKNIKIIRMETHSKKIANEIIKLLKENSFIIEKNKNSIIWSKKI